MPELFSHFHAISSINLSAIRVSSLAAAAAAVAASQFPQITSEN